MRHRPNLDLEWPFEPRQRSGRSPPIWLREPVGARPNSNKSAARLEHIAHHERLDCNATSLRTHTRQRAPHQPQQTAGMVPEPSWPSSATCAAKWPSCGPMAPSTETVPGQGRGSGSRSSTRVTADNSPRCSSTAASSARRSSRVATAPHRRRRTSSGREQRPPARH